jgi:hypothetical protein
MQFDLWGLRNPIVSPKRNHPMFPGGKFGGTRFAEKGRRRKAKQSPNQRANKIGKNTTIVPCQLQLADISLAEEIHVLVLFVVSLTFGKFKWARRPYRPLFFFFFFN